MVIVAIIRLLAVHIAQITRNISAAPDTLSHTAIVAAMTVKRVVGIRLPLFPALLAGAGLLGFPARTSDFRNQRCDWRRLFRIRKRATERCCAIANQNEGAVAEAQESAAAPFPCPSIPTKLQNDRNRRTQTRALRQMLPAGSGLLLLICEFFGDSDIQQRCKLQNVVFQLAVVALDNSLPSLTSIVNLHELHRI